jgi:hypothetical protein
MVGVRVTGGDEFARLAARLKATNDRDVKKAVRSAINRTVTPLRREIKASLPAYLPDQYAVVLRRKLTITARQPRNSVQIVARAKGRRKPRRVEAIDKGILRHPTFGRRGPGDWQAQRVRPGFFTESMHAGAPLIRAEILRALNQIADNIANGR